MTNLSGRIILESTTVLLSLPRCLLPNNPPSDQGTCDSSHTPHDKDAKEKRENRQKHKCHGKHRSGLSTWFFSILRKAVTPTNRSFIISSSKKTFWRALLVSTRATFQGRGQSSSFSLKSCKIQYSKTEAKPDPYVHWRRSSKNRRITD